MLVGDGRRWGWGGGGRVEGKQSGSLKIYLFWLPASLKLPVGDSKMAPLPATERAQACQNVFEWKIQTESSSSLALLFLLSSPLVFLTSLSLSILHQAPQKGSGRLTECRFEKYALCPPPGLSVFTELSASHSELRCSPKIHGRFLSILPLNSSSLSSL